MPEKSTVIEAMGSFTCEAAATPAPAPAETQAPAEAEQPPEDSAFTREELQKHHNSLRTGKFHHKVIEGR
jgi:hypothetical protein